MDFFFESSIYEALEVPELAHAFMDLKVTVVGRDVFGVLGKSAG